MDNLVAGGIELGASPFDTIVKEAEEEAGIPARIAKHAQACGELTFRFIRQNEIMKELKSNCDVDNNTGCTSNVNTTYSTEGTDDSKHANDGNIDSPPSLALSHKPGQQFIFDLEVPPSFTPHNMDGEVEKFILLPIEEVLAQIALDDGRYELNSASVMIDFAMRHGFCDEWTKKEKEDIESVLRLPETSSQERDSFLAMPDEYSFDWQALGTGKSVGGSSKRDTE